MKTDRAVVLLAAALLLSASRGASALDEAPAEAERKAAPAKPAPAKPAAAAAAPAAAAESGPKDLLEGKFTTNASGLKWRDVKVGAGDVIAEGDTASVHYTGWLTDGTKFDSSRDRGQPFKVVNVGKAGVIKGWNEGLLGMRVGGQRRLVIPPDLAYGPSARGKIPANATLVFDVEVMEKVKPVAMPDLSKIKLTTNASGLKWADLTPGTGPEIKAGSNTLMHYTGWLDDGTKFDSSVDRGRPFPVQNVGAAGVIKGWNEGLVGLKQGGTRVLVIPASLGYGERGYPPVIPPGATLVFQVEAVQVSGP